MGKITISLSDDAETKLRKIAKDNVRNISKQVEYYIIQDSKHRKSSS